MKLLSQILQLVLSPQKLESQKFQGNAVQKQDCPQSTDKSSISIPSENASKRNTKHNRSSDNGILDTNKETSISGSGPILPSSFYEIDDENSEGDLEDISAEQLRKLDGLGKSKDGENKSFPPMHSFLKSTRAGINVLRR